MMPPNPHETLGDKQWMFWNQWNDGEPLDFILVDYFKAPVVRKRGLYVAYYAISVNDIPYLNVRKDDELILFITYNAYINALNMLPNEFKVPCLKKFADGKNLFIRIEKVSIERIKVHYQELREPTQEQLLEADKQYGMMREDRE